MLTWGEPLGRSDKPYLRRWVLSLWLFSLRIHHWIGSDDQRCYHDHPWWFLTLILAGGYVDRSPTRRDILRPWSVRLRPAAHQHTVRVRPKGCWSLLLTGPDWRPWGFWVNGKFVKRNKYFFRFGHH